VRIGGISVQHGVDPDPLHPSRAPDGRSIGGWVGKAISEDGEGCGAAQADITSNATGATASLISC